MKPLLFLDVDGVINILPGVHREKKSPPEGFRFSSAWSGVALRPVLVNPDVGRALRALSEDVEIVWLTHWNKAANEVGRIIGLPHLNYVNVPRYLQPDRKCVLLHSHLSWARGLDRVFWVDDQITAEDFEQLSNRLPRAEISALKTDPAVGLRLQDIELLRSEIHALGSFLG